MYSRHRFPGEIMSHCVWLYYTFPLSYRDIEKMMLYRGIGVSYETIREWCQKFGQQYANQLCRKRSFIADQWHLDEVVVTIKKQQYYLWRAVDSAGNVLDVLLQRHRDTKAAKRFFRKLLKKQGFVPRVIVTDKLKSYEAAKKQVMKTVEHRAHKRLNNPCRELPSTDSSARTTHATIQIPRASSTISLHVWTDSRPFPPQATSTDCSLLPPGNAPTISRLARSRWAKICGVN